jgi:hypothetical protein
MKKVFSNSHECAHMFAQRTQNEGKAGNIFFENNVIYSYGYHFPVAQFYDKDNETIVLFTSKNYSNSTAKHKHVINSALSHYTIIEAFKIKDVKDSDHSENIACFMEELKELSKKILSAKKNSEYFLSQYYNAIINANRYCYFFHLGTRFSNELNMEIVKNKIETQKEKATKKVIQERLTELNNLELWKQNKFNGHFYSLDNQYLRLKDSETVETTTGATFPFSHCKYVYNKIKECIANKECWKRNGQQIRIGNFNIDSIDENGNVKAGCHYVTFEEIERFAILTNL